jgi:hypothetical protein
MPLWFYFCDRIIRLGMRITVVEGLHFVQLMLFLRHSIFDGRYVGYERERNRVEQGCWDNCLICRHKFGMYVSWWFLFLKLSV